MKELIKASAMKWWAIMKRYGLDKGVDNCSLCQEYYSEGDCFSCPIDLATDFYGCGGTPYSEWASHQEYHEIYDDRRIHCPECYNLAREEFLFLCRLYRLEK